MSEPTVQGGLRAQILRWKQRLSRWHINWRTRRQLARLAQLDGYLLKDIGVSRGDALEEAAKPFWRD